VDACETSCGHGFCEFCLNSCLENKPGVCPVCQKNPSPIHPSFILRSLVDCLRGPAVAVPPGSVASEKAEGNNCYNLRKYAEAIVHYTLALQKDDADPSTKAVLYANRAQCYIKLEEYRRALDDCDESIRLDPSGDVKAHMRRGHCLQKLGYLSSSKDAYEQARRLDNGNKWKEAIDEALASLPQERNTAYQIHQQQHFQTQTQHRPNAHPQSHTQARTQQNQSQFQQSQYPGHYPPSQFATGAAPRPTRPHEPHPDNCIIQ